MQHFSYSQDSALPALPTSHRGECLSWREGLPASLGLRAVIPTSALLYLCWMKAQECQDLGMARIKYL